MIQLHVVEMNKLNEQKLTFVQNCAGPILVPFTPLNILYNHHHHHHHHHHHRRRRRRRRHHHHQLMFLSYF